jgi:anthranilate synthase component I
MFLSSQRAYLCCSTRSLQLTISSSRLKSSHSTALFLGPLHHYRALTLAHSLKVPENLETLQQAYEQGREVLQRMLSVLQSKDVPLPPQDPIVLNQKSVSNIGKAGYEKHVTTLKKHISRGDIIQAVPSQRFARPTSLHPFNLYRHLRTVNPSPYLFYIECDDFQIVGASPEVLVKSEQGRIITHPIAGTVKRGKTVQEDEALAEELRSSLKDRSV